MMIRTEKLFATLPILVGFLLLGAVQPIAAVEGDPVAVRLWPEEAISVENHWGLSIGVAKDQTSAAGLPDTLDRIVAIDEHLDHVLFREPNQETTSWSEVGDAKIVDPNRFGLRSDEAADSAIRVDVDGVRIVAISSNSELTGEGPSQIAPVDLLAFLGDAIAPSDFELLRAATQFYRPRFILLERNAVRDIPRLRDVANASTMVVERDHNTFAVSVQSSRAEKPTLVLVDDEPWQMPRDLESLFAKMEAANRESQQVFSGLSVRQMNFKPANGTHTPRWNAEHMMARQLLFFSQIYHALDPTIPVIDLNPRQMPSDYVAAHPDWTGAEEARQMQRAGDFARRFAYLLDGLDVDRKAPASSWSSLRALLVQMQHHYGEHTANTVKKFDLPDWPER